MAEACILLKGSPAAEVICQLCVHQTVYKDSTTRTVMLLGR